jgi:hypothetical protein
MCNMSGGRLTIAVGNVLSAGQKAGSVAENVIGEVAWEREET